MPPSQQFAPGSLWGYVAPEEIQAMFDVAEFHGMHESIGNCMVNFPYEAPMDNGVFNWGGDFQWEEYDMAVQAFLECTKGEVHAISQKEFTSIKKISAFPHEFKRFYRNNSEKPVLSSDAYRMHRLG